MIRSAALIAFALLSLSFYLHYRYQSRHSEPKGVQRYCNSPQHGFWLPCEWVPQETEA